MELNVLKNSCKCKSKDDCPCTKDCIRHGDCTACHEHHSKLESSVCCER